ncbi:MAG: response regulator [Rhodocyclaceae bacterium]|nr:response regulator [Rhodocyclaceae bacterium]MDZ4213993.1 response regulator [Rhodocyclaceae bacterium]
MIARLERAEAILRVLGLQEVDAILSSDGVAVIRKQIVIAQEQRDADALRISEARFRTMADAVPIMIWLVGTDKLSHWFNQRWLRFTGRRLEQEIGNGWTQGIHADDRAHCLAVYSDCFDRREEFEVEYRLRNAAGEFRWLLDRGVPEYGPDGRFLGYIGSCLDIAALKQTQVALQQAKEDAETAARAKSAFLANMSHEIRTPLHAVIGLGHLLRRDITQPDQMQKLEQLCASSDHLLALINDILDFSKIEAEEVALYQTDFTIDSLVARVLRLVEGSAQAKGLTLTTDMPASLGCMRLTGDALRLAQVLINLCGNAVKFTERGGVRLKITCLDEEADRITLSFAVADSGCGIASTQQEKLFQPFAQGDDSMTKEYAGTGLGLAISQRLIKLMGSTIQIESQIGAGSTFSFDVVLSRAVSAVEHAPVTVATAFYGNRVLFADDNEQSQEILLEMLEDLGCATDVASDGAEAVDLARARPYDLILMDMRMPKMDGLAATRAIRALPAYHNTPIIALTANAYAEDRQRCLDAGMNDHQSKPVTPTALAETLGRWLSAVPVTSIETPLCDNQLSRALLQIAGLQIPSAWLSSAEQLVAYRTHLERFLKTNSQDMAQLHLQLAAGEFDAARELAHDQKGIAGLLGARQIASLASEIEQGLRSAVPPSLIVQLAHECDAQRASLAKALEEGLTQGTQPAM